MPDLSFFEKRVGTLLRGKWTLEKLLGVGGMAAVYVGVHKIGRRDAIKILHPDIARSKDLRDRFEQEAHAVNLFKHPGAVEIRDIDTSDDGAPFLVMELLEGETLSERARRQNGIETGEMLRLVDELLDVLTAAHAQGIVHRDIKLDNLFFQKNGHLKVLDFGIARMRTGGARALLTRTGATLGTVAYMPPEQVKGTEVDHRADLFAAGATMYRLVAKRRIHEAKNESDLLVKMATEPAAPLASVAPGAPAALCAVVDRALAFQRARRYPDAATMQQDVRALRSGAAPPYAAARLAEGDHPGSKEAPAGADGVPSAYGVPSAFRDAVTAAAPSGPAMPAQAFASVDPTAATSRAGHDLSLDTPPPAAMRTGGTDPTFAGPQRTATGPHLPSIRDAATMTGPVPSRTASGPYAAVSAGVPPSHHTPPPPSMQNPPMYGSAPFSASAPTTTPSVAGAPESTLKSAMTPGPPVPGAPASFAGAAPLSGHSPTSPSAVMPAHDSNRPPKGGTVQMVGPPSQHTSDRPMPATVPVVAAMDPVRPKRESMTPLLVMGGLFLVIGIGLGLWFGLRGSGADAVSPEAAASAAAAPPELPADSSQPSPSGAGSVPKIMIKPRTTAATPATTPPGPAQTAQPPAQPPAQTPTAPPRPPTLGPSPTAPSPPGKGKHDDKHDKKDR